MADEVTGAREIVLERLRSALTPAPPVPEVPRRYERATAGRADIDTFCGRLLDYRARVHRVSAGELERALAGLGRGRVAVPPAIDWRLPHAELLVDDPPLTARELDGVDAVMTGCALAIAETGTIVLDGSALCGRRALTLVPDHHVCVVRTGQVVSTVPDAIAALHPERPITLISGPSATSDIELERVEGVHGPRVLDVVVVHE